MILEAVDISRSYPLGGRGVQALAPVNVGVDKGEFLVVTGPSGSGKSTLLNILSGFDRPSSGDVRFHGKTFASLTNNEIATLRNSSFGFIYQTPHLIADKTVIENVALVFHYGSWVEKKQVQQRCGEMLEYVGLSGLSHRYPATLSGGEMQRVVFARALTREPEVIFADEPTGSLDEGNSVKILEMLKQQTKLGRTVIMVTHDVSAIGYGSKVLNLTKGRPVGLEVE